MEATGVGRTNTKQCQWCGEQFGNITDKLVHVHEDHPETIGRGRTRSLEWTCFCGVQNGSSEQECTACGDKPWFASMKNS